MSIHFNPFSGQSAAPQKPTAQKPLRRRKGQDEDGFISCSEPHRLGKRSRETHGTPEGGLLPYFFNPFTPRKRLFSETATAMDPKVLRRLNEWSTSTVAQHPSLRLCVDKALNEIHDFLRDPEGNLDLRGLDLPSLPRVLHLSPFRQGLETLACSGNQLKDLEQFRLTEYSALRLLDISDNPIAWPSFELSCTLICTLQTKAPSEPL
jgi:hypothetical protein